jgi:GH15 family glucan-1,4-alpha-glucosidase
VLPITGSSWIPVPRSTGGGASFEVSEVVTSHSHRSRQTPSPTVTGERPHRLDGYAPIRDYAAIGDGRTAALVSLDGSIDWLPLPDIDSPTVFAALLDARRGGRFALAPELPYETRRRYLPETNVLETTFVTGRGVVRVTDAMTLPDGGLPPFREVCRRVEGLSGAVPMRWSVEPRFGYAAWPTRTGRRRGVPVVTAGSDALAACSWGAGDPEVTARSIGGGFEAGPGSPALLALAAAHQEPLVLPTRQEVEARLEITRTAWGRWAGRRHYEGPWRDAVVRSALALRLLVHAPSGAIAAAATTSLPEAIGGERNWDYRYCWVRDAAFALDALIALRCRTEAESFFWWLLQASQLTHPRLKVLYRMDGGARAPEQTLALEGYRSSYPVRVGNAAVDQAQLDIYGDLLQTAWLYAGAEGQMDADVGRRLEEIADLVSSIWRHPDRGIWEVRSEPTHFTQSKMMCWIALDRALRLAEQGMIHGRNSARWIEEREAIAVFIETQCWSADKGSYVRSAGAEDLDASLLLGALFGYRPRDPERMRSTVDAVRRELGHGPFVYRYTGQDGLSGKEGAFLACSFWLAEALARWGRVDEAASLMDELVGLSNDVGLYAEEIDPSTRDFLGNFPQALTHLSLVRAALAIGEEAHG